MSDSIKKYEANIQKQKLKMKLVTDTLQQSQENTDKQNSNSETKAELVRRTEIKDTPFTIVRTKGKSFGTIGKYRVTEEMENDDLVEEELKKITWNRIIQVMMIVNTHLENAKPLTEKKQ